MNNFREVVELLTIYPSAPPRNNCAMARLTDSQAGSWRVPDRSRHDSVLTLSPAELENLLDKPPPYDSVHSEFI